MASANPENFIGIDLGTSNVAAYLQKPEHEQPQHHAITQVQAPGVTEAAPTLPSMVYLAPSSEADPSSLMAPWGPTLLQAGTDDTAVLGAFARSRGSETVGRLVHSAKSWLCHPYVDRESPLLPWPSSKPAQFSPVAVSGALLHHVRASLVEQEGAAAVDNAEVAITVPASFDEVARNLTVVAARQAGFASITLLEEPMAAFYAWLEQQGEQWRTMLEPGDTVLVCDVGGGTSDFSLIAAVDCEGDLQLERIAVGQHLLLGGDNMDLALAYALRQRCEEAGQTVSDEQFAALVHGAKLGKERLFTDSSIQEFPIALASSGADLFAASFEVKLHRDDLQQLLLEGFFPQCGVKDHPPQQVQMGLQEVGLPYESCAAITQHLAAFLCRSSQQLSPEWQQRLGCSPGEPLIPLKILFNGGVFKAEPLRQRLMDVVRQWLGGGSIEALPTADLDLAVAAGACSYARRHASGEGIRVRAGTSRAYYLGIASSGMAVPGRPPQVKGLCVVPRGTEEGSQLSLPRQTFALSIGQPVDFRFFASEERPEDQLGTVVDDACRGLAETAPLRVTLTALPGQESGVVPVYLKAEVSAVGTLDLSLQHTESQQSWQLAFNVRDQEA